MGAKATHSATSDLKEELAVILARHEKELEDFGEKVAREVVKPMCRKYRLVFSTGMGTFFFKKAKASSDFVTWGDSKDLDLTPGLSEKAKTALRPVLDLLNEEIHHGHYVGFLFDDVA